MTAEMHHLLVPPPIMKPNFWLYAWRVGLPSGGYTHYVGMTGDTGFPHAQSAANRVAAHLGFGIANALRKYVLRKNKFILKIAAHWIFSPSGRCIRSPRPLIIKLCAGRSRPWKSTCGNECKLAAMRC